MNKQRITDVVLGFEHSPYRLEAVPVSVTLTVEGGATFTEHAEWAEKNKPEVGGFIALAVPLAYFPPERAPAAALDPVVEANRQMLLDRSNVGVKKYGVTLGDSGLSLRALLQHALEETLDHANYLQAAIQELDREAQRSKS